MNIQSLFVSVILITTPVTAFAHSSGHGEGKQVDIIPIANDHVKSLITEGVDVAGIGELDPSWSNVPSANKKFTKKNGAYIVSFKHPQENKTLYLLMSPSGNLYDVNFTGQFKNL